MKLNTLPKCLLVDDLEENLIALSGLLKNEEMIIFTAQSGEQALELMLKNDFAFAMIDVQMPGMSGFELAEIMRSTDKTKSIPIIFVTAAGSSAERIFEGYEAGAIDFLHKPLAVPVVLGKVRVFLDLYRNKILLEQKLEKIKETESYLQKALRSRDEFLSICSHELKTPLTSLKMQIQMINRQRHKAGDEKAFSIENMDRFMKQADRSVERIIHLVNDMLDISRVTTGRLSLNLEEVNLYSLAVEVSERLEPFMEMANCKLKIEGEKDVTGKWDKFRIEQVLTNLLTNAAKYAPDCPVEISIKKQNDFVNLSVIDHGEGISEADQRRIFERFERAVNSNLVSGLGLGLFISKEIIEMHKGELQVKSVPGEGSVFTIRLPL